MPFIHRVTGPKNRVRETTVDLAQARRLLDGRVADVARVLANLESNPYAQTNKCDEGVLYFDPKERDDA